MCKRYLNLELLLGMFLLAASPLSGAYAAATVNPNVDISFLNEVQHSIDRGLAWLKTNQNPKGWWASPETPALTALALMSFKGDPLKRYNRDEPEWLKKGYDYLLSCAKADGGIHQSNLVTYNTAISMMALVAANKPEYDPVLRKARQFLVGLQGDFGEKGKMDSPFDGGIGYGSHYEHSDMGNTLAALEALYYTQRLVQDQNLPGGRDLDWQAAISFLQSCQNLPAYNKQPWASDDPKNKGGFIYYPGHSMAGGETNSATGRVTLRSYGSISYGGLLSYIYANLKKDDPRVVAVYDWLRKNYSVEENPGMGLQGLFFYYHTMSKALSIYGADTLELANGQKINWRKDLAMRLINLQQKDGSWANENGRWWEKDPNLVTCYSVIALEMAARGLSPER